MDITAALDAAEAVEAPAEVAETADTAPEAANDNAEMAEALADGAPEGDEQAAETAEPEKQSQPATQEAPEDALFTDEALKTPDGIKKAREALLAGRDKSFRKARELDGRDIRLKNKEKKLAADKDAWVRDKAQDRNFIQDVRNTVQLMRTGNAVQRMQALERLTGQPGQKAYEELSLGIIHDGKKQPLSPEVAAMQEQIQGLYGVIDRLVKGTAQAQTQAEKQQQEQFLQQRQAELIEAGKDAAQYPNLSNFIAAGKEAEVAEYLTEMKVKHLERTGTVLDDGDALGQVERELTKAFGARAAKPTSLGPPQKPSGHQAQRTPGHKAIPPSLAARSNGSVRDMTEDERLDELTRDPEFMRLFG